MKSAFAILFMALIVPVAYGADPLAANNASTLSSAYLGTDYLNMTGWDSYLIGCGSLGCGGEFGGAITNSLSESLNANFFCVDAQEDFNWGTNGYADVVPLTQIDTNAPEVRYSNVSNNNSPTWTYTPSNTSPSVALSSDPQLRFQMAAWLLQQYVGGTPNSNLNSSTDSDIQEAIWDLTSNSTNSVDTDFAPPQSNTAVWAWVNAAESACITGGGAITASCLSATDNWAIVSWSTSSSGSLSGSPNYQTFLVQLSAPVVTTNAPLPEPSFYGVLSLGALGLVFGALRKKRKLKNHPVV